MLQFLYSFIGNNKPENDAICIYHNEIIMFSDFCFSIVLLICTILCFFLLRHRIRQILKDNINKQNLEEKYFKGLSRFLIFLIFVTLLSISDFIVYFQYKKIAQSIMLIIADLLEVTFYPFIAMVYCFNHESFKIIKDVCCCQKNANYDKLIESIITERSTIRISEPLSESHTLY